MRPVKDADKHPRYSVPMRVTAGILAVAALLQMLSPAKTRFNRE